MTTCAPNSSENQRVLIFKSGAPFLFDQAVREVRDRGADVTVDAYCPRQYRDELTARGDLDEVFDDGWDGFFDKSDISASLVNKLKGRGYDQVVLLYSNEFGEGYDALRSLAFKVKPPRVSTLNIHRTWSSLDGRRLLSKHWQPQVWIYKAMLAAFVVELVATTAIDRAAHALSKLGLRRPPLPRPHRR